MANTYKTWTLGYPYPQSLIIDIMDKLRQVLFYCCLGNPEDFYEEEAVQITLSKVPPSLDLVRETAVIIQIQPRKVKSHVNATEGDEILGIPIEHIFHNS